MLDCRFLLLLVISASSAVAKVGVEETGIASPEHGEILPTNSDTAIVVRLPSFLDNAEVLSNGVVLQSCTAKVRCFLLE